MNDAMDTEREILPPTSDDIEAHARDTVTAMRAAGTDRPDIERALVEGARRHARFVEGAIMPEGEAEK